MTIPRRFKLPKRLALLAMFSVVVLLQACSTIKLGYNNAVDLSYWWLDDYVDFNEAQTTKVREELDRLHKWHRTVELPKIAALLQNSRGLLANDVTAAQVCLVFAETRTRMEAVSKQAENGIASIATTVTAEQRQRIARKFEKSNAKWREEWFEGNAEERQKKRLKASVERAEQLYDSLDDKQIALLRDLDSASSYDAELSFKERLRRQQDLLQTLSRINPANAAEKPGPPQALGLYHDWLERNAKSPDSVYRDFAEKMTAESCNSFAAVHNSTTPKQRDRAANRVAAYLRDARELAGITALN